MAALRSILFDPFLWAFVLGTEFVLHFVPSQPDHAVECASPASNACRKHVDVDISQRITSSPPRHVPSAPPLSGFARGSTESPRYS